MAEERLSAQTAPFRQEKPGKQEAVPEGLGEGGYQKSFFPKYLQDQGSIVIPQRKGKVALTHSLIQ